MKRTRSFSFTLLVILFELFWPIVQCQNNDCSNLCWFFKGNCTCSQINDNNIRLDCLNTNSHIFMIEIESLCSNLNLLELHVKDSNLQHLYNLPSRLYNVQKLILDNTGIDLETIRESSELLKSLKVLRIINENFTEIPESLFDGMESLKELSLNRLGMAYINVDAFLSLQDSLTSLELRYNRIRTIPTAVTLLSHLESLDLTGNDIKTVSDGNGVIFNQRLKRLKKLRLNPLNCTCEFGQSKFARWLRTYAIKGVECLYPERLMEKDVSNMPIEEFCQTSASNADTFNYKLLSIIIVAMIMLFQ